MEIERKFLIHDKDLPNLDFSYQDIIQGYLPTINSDYIFRLRHVIYVSSSGEILTEKYFQTIKSYGLKVREEFESEISKETFLTFWPLCEENKIHKRRYEFLSKNGKNLIELDVYYGLDSDLVIAEVEFESEDECDRYSPEFWFGREVTEDPAYSNYNLAVFGIKK